VLQGRYRLDAQLASGAMGVVYKGQRVQLERPVAVKFLHPWIATQKAFLTRFDTEARAMSRLQHPNCVSVIDFGVEGTPYLVMDFVTGKTLREVVSGGRLETQRALRIVRQLLAGLGYAHAQGIIHRDLKPENLILSEEPGLTDHLRILDFGLAKLRDGPAMTAGLAVGTPSYMSPEQTGAEGAIDARTDLYAVGVVLFELLAGRKPFQSENVGELLLMHREAPPPLLRAAVPEAALSAELEAVVGKALSKFADDRYQTAADFTAAIDATPEGRGVAPAAPAAARAAGAAARAAGAAARAVGAAALPVPASAAKGARPVPKPADATIVDSPSRIERIMSGEPGRAAPPRNRRLVWAGVGLGAAAVAALLVGRSLHGDGGAAKGTPKAAGETARAGEAPAKASRPSAATPASAVARAAPGAPSAPPPADLQDRLADARRVLASGNWEQARASVEGLRAQAPDDPDVAYLLATIDLEHHRYGEGMAAAHVAVRRNPSLKSDPDLIKDVIGALASDPVAERAEQFLRGAGPQATPFLKDAAHKDPNPRVRDRASALLAERGGGRSSGGWWSSSSSRSSSSSAFHR
jgi:serine/threonine-protein kinase